MRQRRLEHLLLLGAQFAQVGVDALHRAVLCEQLRGADRAHALHSRHIVRRIPAKRQHIDNLRRAGDVVLGAELRRAIDFLLSSALARLVLEDMVLYQLAVVLVGRDHVYVHAFKGAALRKGADHVVRLEASDHQHRYAQRLHYIAERLEGVDDQLGRFAAIGLVLRVELVAEGPSGRVESHSHVRRLLLVYELQQIPGESEEYGSVLSLRIDHGPAQKGIVHLENQGVAVNQEQFHHSSGRNIGSQAGSSTGFWSRYGRRSSGM